jgi:hypothetical protein
MKFDMMPIILEPELFDMLRNEELHICTLHQILLERSDKGGQVARDTREKKTYAQF